MQNTYWKLLLALTILLGLSSCSETPADGPFVGQVIGWQSYCPLVYDAGAANRQSGEIRIQQLDVATRHSHSMFAFAKSGRVHLKDLVSGEQWALEGHRLIPHAPVGCGPFSIGNITVQDGNGYVEACDTSCHRIEIKDGTWVYAYAYANSAILAATNFGDVVIYKNKSWCRTTRSKDDAYTCPKNEEPTTLQEPRKVQFYSSLSFDSFSLVGEWPTGRIYKFDGNTLAPTESQPPFTTREPIGYEAQSMATYCGDLYIGYWPTGEIWKRHTTTGEWSLAASLFDRSEDFIPYIDRHNNKREAAFYGRRVTALVPTDNGLIAATSNLRGWEPGYLPQFMNAKEAEQYGSIYRIEIECKTPTEDATSPSYKQ